jgi:hypothetical protein
LVELFLILPRKLAARWVSLIEAFVVAVAGSAARAFTVTGTQVPACAGSAIMAQAAMAPNTAQAIKTLLRVTTAPCRFFLGGLTPLPSDYAVFQVDCPADSAPPPSLLRHFHNPV